MSRALKTRILKIEIFADDRNGKVVKNARPGSKVTMRVDPSQFSFLPPPPPLSLSEFETISRKKVKIEKPFLEYLLKTNKCVDNIERMAICLEYRDTLNQGW